MNRVRNTRWHVEDIQANKELELLFSACPVTGQRFGPTLSCHFRHLPRITSCLESLLLFQGQI